MREDFEPFDLRRMFIGDFSPLLMLEIGVRTIIMYSFALIVVRFIGKRGLGQVTPFEFIIVLALGSATGDPMFYPEVPLVHGMLVLTMVVAMEKFVSGVARRNGPVQRMIDSSPTLVVEAGKVLDDVIKSEGLPHEELLMWLREAGVRNVGEVQYAFLESSGRVTVFRYDDVRTPGESTLTPIGARPGAA